MKDKTVTIFEQIFRMLNEAQVAYLVVGGVAVNLHVMKDIDIPVVSIQDLIAMKKRAARPQDMTDVAALEELKKYE